tara:strand:+ start:59 stop:592 length:534 start_codon:yes stop_codon:yes gene_type:complete
LKNSNNIAIVFIIFLAAVSRLLPHPPNFTPIMAIGFLGGLFLKNYRFVYAIPLLAMLSSDIVLEIFYGYGFHVMMPFVYGGIIMCTFMGSRLNMYSKVPKVIGYTLTSSFIFFLVSNFGVWLYGYPKTVTGFISCYTLALPFYKNALAGDLFYTVAIFGLYVLYQNLISNVASDIVK